MTVTQYHLAQVLGTARLRRFIHAGWLAPAKRTPTRILYRVLDVHAALRRLEAGEVLPPDQIKSARTNGSAMRNGRGYVWGVRLSDGFIAQGSKTGFARSLIKPVMRRLLNGANIGLGGFPFSNSDFYALCLW
jgi:hypothetical protein